MSPPTGMDENTWKWVCKMSPAMEYRIAEKSKNEGEEIHRFGHSNEGISETSGALMLCGIILLFMATFCMVYRVYFMKGKRLS